MKILHYTLGFPPARSGGLVRYAVDLMEEQYKQGHEVTALYPGEINLFTKKTYIKSVKSKNLNKFQIVNSLPLAIFGGIRTPEDFMEKISIKIYIDFIKTIKPDVIHIHTLIGIHKEFFLAAKSLNKRIVYTSHDYFGLAPEPNFFYKGKSYDQKNTVETWIRVSENALNTKELRLFQSKFYPYIRKGTKFLEKQFPYTKNKEKQRKNNSSVFFNEENKKSYSQLKEYYQEIFSLIDKFHFNSKMTKEVFISNVHSPILSEVISITNSRINNMERVKKSNSSKIRLAYIGSDKEFKGFDIFIEASKKLSLNSYEFHTYGYVATKKIKNIHQHGKYDIENLVDIYKNIDILIVPSKCKETFGLIVLEALSNNTPLFVSENVGAKDLIPDEYVFSTIDELLELIVSKQPQISKYNSKVKNVQEHVKEIISFYDT